MKALVKVRKRDSVWGVRLTVGVQTFWLDYYANWEDARYMAKMLKKALSNAGATVNTRV
jgi:hypothetical protein